MVLVDTSVWVIHFRRGEHHLDKLLVDAEVACHSFISIERFSSLVEDGKIMIHLSSLTGKKYSLHSNFSCEPCYM